jgi:PAS domain S-box-containing protein
MKSQLLDQELKNLARDEAAYQRLKEIILSAEQARLTAEQNLSLLERAIKGDYDSILVTEVNLDFPGPRIVYVNEGFTRMTGYRREEVVGKTPRILQGPKTDRATLDRLKKSLLEGRSFFGQAVNYRKDGSEFINQWDIHPLYDEQGTLTHWVSYQHDITARKKAELTFLENDVEFDDLYENSKRTLIDLDRQGNILMANKAMRELLGYDKDTLKGKHAWDLLPARFRAHAGTRYDLMWEEANSRKLQYQVIAETKEGGWVQLEVETKVLNLSEMTVMRLSIKNLSLQKKVKRTLARRNRQFDSVFAHFQDK